MPKMKTSDEERIKSLIQEKSDNESISDDEYEDESEDEYENSEYEHLDSDELQNGTSLYYNYMNIALPYLERIDRALELMESLQNSSPKSKRNSAINFGGKVVTSILNKTGKTVVGAITGPVSVSGLGIILNLAVDGITKKIDDHLKFVDSYPKTSKVISELNNYDTNLIIKLFNDFIKKDKINKNNVKEEFGLELVKKMVNSLSEFIPIYELINLAISQYRAMKKIEKNKVEKILNFTNKLRENINENYPYAEKFLNEKYKDHKMRLTGFKNQLRSVARKVLTPMPALKNIVKYDEVDLPMLIDKKGKIEKLIISINERVRKLAK
ncbi:hypothetical protein Xsto_01021 [Xenorhabdus stockiae]|uniref:Uncharacterized protein n=1 Tax=Xenorhabdus stockiae TaxID=351614 RepID=A0A2D0KTE5_9GAMM|nr:hypothetical protein [Xenorhabdus stockiae]PHM66692.1 hypothetical protein Xsto_01021 [Xenorhabdus stockiae]